MEVPHGSAGRPPSLPGRRPRRRRWEGALLFAGSAGVVVWQVTRVAVLWDLSAILETAQRMAAGDVPYREFPLVYPPGTFLIQAGIIRVFGSHYFLHTLYAALVSGAASCLVLAVLREVMRDRPRDGQSLAFVLALPLVPLGIYSVLPHPFYDPDACFFMLVGLWGVLLVRSRGFPSRPSLLAGAALVLPFFVKQNVGLAFLVLVHLALNAALLGEEGPRARPGYRSILTGSALGLLVGALGIELAFGLRPYLHWTVAVAASERLRHAGLGLGMYLAPSTLASAGLVAVGLLISQRPARRWTTAAAWLALLTPSAWIAWSSLAHHDAVLSFWPFVLLVSCASSAILLVSQPPTFPMLLPFVCAGVAHASFLAQGLDGSSYGIWPLLVVALSAMVMSLERLMPPETRQGLVVFVVGTVAAMSIAGFVYVSSEERLSYARVTSGPLHHSTIPALWGLSARGAYLPDLDEVLRYLEAHVPPGDAMVVLPGEDPVYFALGRRPRFPVLLFDTTTTDPYSPPQLEEMSRRMGVRWVLVKQRLQLGEPPAGLDETVAALRQGFQLVARPGSYLVFERRAG